ncbi:MAG: hypothetical protein C3F14_04880 [Deltaproteobacteria bacterium]|nr:MAG: hypothetical protein C3F14_04880 [Deltaproteobacteria bacterium]
MSEQTIISEEMKKAVGSLLNVKVSRIERRAVEEYVSATTDSNPLWQDDDFAMREGLGGALVPPAFLLTMQMEGGSPSDHMPSQAHLGGAVDGGGEWEFHRPVRVGDVITAVRRFVAINEKKGKLGPMVLNTFEVTYYNQRSEMVAKSRWTTIRYSTTS